MRQVPRFLLIGNGRVARHFQHYFSLSQISFEIWERSHSLEQLTQLLEKTTHILLLISDGAIEDFIRSHLSTTTAIKLHFSGSLVSDQAYGAHPLMTFGAHLYTLEQYQQIPFILDHDCPEFKTILPGLSNQHMRLNKSLKAKYHALCVMSGNFSCLLWQKLLTSFEQEFGLSPEIAFPYLLQQTQNLLFDAKNALTGPLARGDMITIEKNLAALNTDHSQAIYQSFVTYYQKITEEPTT